MLMELQVSDKAMPAMRDAILALRSRDDVLVFRRGLEWRDIQGWTLFLQHDCGLRVDPRQVDADAILQIIEWAEIYYDPAKAYSYQHSNTAQPLHTDNAWLSKPAEVNMFAMNKQAVAGGEQVFYPLSRLMEDLAKDDSSLLRDLCSAPVNIRKGDHGIFNTTTIIVEGNDPKIFWNYYRTEKTSPAIESMCQALFDFLGRKVTAGAVERLRCETGDCFGFNDQKVLHGRAAFTAGERRERVLSQSMWYLP